MLNFRIALITGAAKGLGRAIAERLAQDEFAIVIADIDGHEAIKTASELGELGVHTLGLRADVADETSVAEAYAVTLQRFGRLDVLVNNAGISGRRTSVEEMSLLDWERTLQVNLTGTFLMARSAIPVMKRNHWGRIVNIASQAARSRTGMGKSQYAASKAGMVGFSRVLADEVGRDGITVNCVAPSRTMTALTMANAAGNPAYFEEGIAQTAVGRLATTLDTANVVSFLCSDQASFLTGTVIDVTGGAFMPQ